jgi:hypothetical protein
MSANKGVRRPRRMVWICLVVAVVSSALVAWGAHALATAGETLAASLAVGVAGPVAVISVGILVLAINNVRFTDALLRGENVIAHWIVSPDDYAAFAANNAARNALGPAYRNDWKLPGTIPPQGIEVVFGQDIVMVGDRFFSLVSTGMFTFRGVQILAGPPPAIEFGTKSSLPSHGASGVRMDVSTGVLRIPVARLARADAERVFDHYKRVDAREKVVNPGFYRRRIRFGLIAAPVFFVAAALGATMQYLGINANGIVNLLLALVGVICGIAALILAGIAAYLGRQQHRRR